MALRPLQPQSALPTENASIRGKTIEQTYQKLSQLEHILLRPDTYIGSAERVSQTMPVWDDLSQRMVSRAVTYPPGLYKIFDEILVNAADHMQRCASMTSMRVEIEPENNRISVWNDGTGIPIEMHEKEGVYVPELIFGHLLTSSNYDDDEKKVVGGRNGYGAKLANIFSTEFVVETADRSRGKKYKQVFRNNMNDKSKPTITNSNKKDDWTRITFFPDLDKFGMTSLDNDIVALMKKRVYDVAGVSPRLKVLLNGERIAIKSFKDYVALYHEEEPSVPFMYSKSGDRWEVAVGASDGQLEQVSFVNSIWTIKGGSHVAHVVDQLVVKIAEHVAKKNKGMKLKPHQIKPHLFVFVNSLVENPAFDSQTKETLTSKPSQFGSKFVLAEEFTKKILKSQIIDNVLALAKFKQSRELTKTDGGKKARVLGIPKLDDANKAGGRESSKCTLILTEGDSAKTLAISGLSVIGRDYYGVFPLRGKLLNVREASSKQIVANAEIGNLKKILGLQQNENYTADNVKRLRYGHVLIMTDQDHDGSHIKGLLINFFQHFWPSLLKIDGFLQEFITPIVKCVKGQSQKVFFTIPEYKTWLLAGQETKASGAIVCRPGWKAKYYKGLGTSSTSEAKEYFSNLCRHLLSFRWSGEDDGKMIELAFAKARVNDRKDWLTNFDPSTYFDHVNDELNFSNFVNKELILFSIADNARSIPNVIDGMKPSQRKVLFGCFRRKLTKNEVKVIQLSGYVSEHTAYHHGEVSLQSTIVGMAQNFVGSNNINLLEPAGQFGTRLQGGKDAASSRYIFTKLAPVARAVFPEADDALLKYLEDDGLSIEPEWFCPIIPMVLVNGADGIGTGWSVHVPCYNPRDLIDNLRRLIHGEQAKELIPWYRGFEGSIIPVGNAKSFDVHGTVLYGNEENTVVVRELPVRSWTTPYKEFLESQVSGSPEAEKDAFIKDYNDESTESRVSFTIAATPEGFADMQRVGFHKRLKLTGSVSTSNMMLFDSSGRIARYEDTMSILHEFYDVRKKLYERRRNYIISVLEHALEILDNKRRFILLVVDGKLKVAKRKKSELLAELVRLKFQPNSKGPGPGTPDSTPSEEEESSSENEGNSDSHVANDKDFDYLLSLPLWSLTMERVQKLCEERDAKEAERDAMRNTTPGELWLKDLDNLEAVLDKCDAADHKEAAEMAKAAAAARRRQAKAAGKTSRSRAKLNSYTEFGVNAAGNNVDLANMISPPEARVVSAPKPRKPKAAPSCIAPRTSGGKGTRKAAKKTTKKIELEEYDSEEDEGDFEDLVSDDTEDVGDDEADPIESFEMSPPDEIVDVDNSATTASAPAQTAKSNKAPVVQKVIRNESTVVVETRVVDSSDDEGELSLGQRLARREALVASLDKSNEGISKTPPEAGPKPLATSQAATLSKKSDAGPGRTEAVSKRSRSGAKKTAVAEVALASPSPAPRKKKSRIVSPAASKVKGKAGSRKAAATRTRKTTTRKAVAFKHKEDEEVEAEAAHPEKALTPKPAPRARRATAKARAIVVDSTDDEEDSGDSSDFDVDDADDYSDY